MLRILTAAAFVATASAHVALWDKGMFGYNYPYQAGDSNNNYNNDISVHPLRQSDNLQTDQWFAHGYKSFPPKSGDFMVLPAGGTYNGDVNCNRAGSRMRDPQRTDALPKYACDGEGALHTTNRFNNSNVDNSRFGGTALAIAYTSDASSLQPGDMTVISVNQASVWFREISYDIPAGLPPCPSGGCLCTWNWIHKSGNGEGYGQEIYNNLYRCTVTGQTDSSKKVQKGLVPKDCTGNSGSCVKGAKQPMYLYQASGNNLPDLPTPPNYNDNWGFYDGAQNDIFSATSTSGGGATTPTATSLPSGWSALGCYVDQDPRSLGVALGASDDQSISSCTAACAKLGHTYAGLESGKECWCSSNPKLVSAPASDCQSPCTGDGWASCGGDWRLSVFKAGNAAAPTATSTAKPTAFPSAKLPSGWSIVGCVVDSGTSRTLDSGSTTSSSNTVLSCIEQAQDKGLAYAGVQYGQECWGGTAASKKNFKIVSNDECNVACAGDAGTLCGGSYRLNIYANNALASSTSQAVSSSTVRTSASTKPATTTSTAAAATSTFPAPSGWSSLGCHVDSQAARLLPAYSTSSSSNSPGWCTSLCASKGYIYAGTEYGSQCYCGNTLKPASTTGCTMACAGDKGAVCGGNWKMNVYKKSSASNEAVDSGFGNGVDVSESSSAASTESATAGAVTVTVTVTQTEACAATQMAKRRIHWHNPHGDGMLIH